MTNFKLFVMKELLVFGHIFKVFNNASNSFKTCEWNCCNSCVGFKNLSFCYSNLWINQLDIFNRVIDSINLISFQSTFSSSNFQHWSLVNFCIQIRIKSQLFSQNQLISPSNPLVQSILESHVLSKSRFNTSTWSTKISCSQQLQVKD